MNKKKNVINKNIILIIIFTVLGVLLDQITKLYIRYSFTNLSCVECLSDLIKTGGIKNGFNIITGRGIEIIKDFFYITFVKNTGGAWGIFSGNVIVLAIVSLLVVFALIYFFKNEKNITKLTISYYSLLFSGVIGNFIDRITYNYVTDFLNFYIFGYDYPVFNIADIFIVLGIMLMAIDVVRSEVYAHKKYKRECKN